MIRHFHYFGAFCVFGVLRSCVKNQSGPIAANEAACFNTVPDISGLQPNTNYRSVSIGPHPLVARFAQEDNISAVCSAERL